MSKLISTEAILGARDVVARARGILDAAIREYGAARKVGFPGTAYYLPVIHSFTGRKVETLGDITGVLDECDGLLPAPPSESLWLPYLGDVLDAGAATLFAFEAIEAMKTVVGPSPVDGIWLGAANDVIMRERGVEFVDGTAPGFAAVVGAAPEPAIAVRIARELQEKSLYVFMAGSSHGTTFAEQLHAEGVQLGWETRLVPFGRDVSAAIHALGFASRAALAFGGVAPGDFRRNLRYNKNRIFAFVLALGPVDREKYAAAAGAINYGFPTIADTDIPQILPTGVCTYEHVVSNVPLDRIVERALEVRGCKVKVTKVPIPVPYGPAFEGERIRKAEVQVEFGGNITTAFEFVHMVEMGDIDDGVIEVIGPEVDAVPEGSALPLAIWVEVAGRKMQPDFEPILERQIHHLVNGAEGVWHMGQRDIVWTRISKGAFRKGFRLRHYGEIIHAKLLGDYPAIVDKVRVTLITERDEVERRVAGARKVYVERNRRLKAMTDESVDVFYSCLLCQSFAPNHVCIITPERLGLCGAYNWLDGKAAFEIDETGPNRKVEKGRCLDPVRGIWEGVNECVHVNSHKTVSSFTAYSLMDRPMTSCGCFECIIAYVPELNGVMVVNREYGGETPCGMTFSSLAGSVGGGVQTPGFMGVGKAFLLSRKLLFADGGLRRIAWMTRQLKEYLGEDFLRRCAEEGVPDLPEKIADEGIATSPGEILAFLKKAGHPALSMPDMARLWPAPGADGNGPPAPQAPASAIPAGSPAASPVAAAASLPASTDVPADLIARLRAELKEEVLREVVGEIIGGLEGRFLEKGRGLPQKGEEPKGPAVPPPAAGTLPAASAAAPAEGTAGAGTGGGEALHRAAGQAPGVGSRPIAPGSLVEAAVHVASTSHEKIASVTVSGHASARPAIEMIAGVKSFPIPRDPAAARIQEVSIGARPDAGGTRGRTVAIGGQTAMPFHAFEGDLPHMPALAIEVFDSLAAKFPAALRRTWGDLLLDPARMAKAAVEEHGADLISVRLEGTHPEKGGRTPDDAWRTVESVLRAVDIPLVITAHNHFESANAVLKRVAAEAKGERLLLNWVEGENYRTIAGAALAYGHCVVARSPIDVNLAKQLNILLGNLDLPRDRIVMDPLTGGLGYGLEYTFSCIERMRLTGLGGDAALAFPMMVHAGQEAWKAKEANATAEAFPAWGDGDRRGVLWEVGTAMPLILAGADLVIFYHPGALAAVRRNVERIRSGLGGRD